MRAARLSSKAMESFLQEAPLGVLDGQRQRSAVGGDRLVAPPEAT